MSTTLRNIHVSANKTFKTTQKRFDRRLTDLTISLETLRKNHQEMCYNANQLERKIIKLKSILDKDSRENSLAILDTSHKNNNFAKDFKISQEYFFYTFKK